MTSHRSVIVLGAGGHARVVADALLASGRKVLGFLDQDRNKHSKTLLGLPVIGGDEVLATLSTEEVELANGIGSAGVMQARKNVYLDARRCGFAFTTVLHPSAIVAPSAHLCAGAQVFARAVIQPLATIGENSIVNTGAIIEHDAVIGSHVHVSPGSLVAGEVRVGDCVHVGIGAVIIQRVCIGNEALIAAGAVVVDDVPDGMRVMGVPAKAQA